MRVIHPEEARFFMDGPEACREYLVSGKVTFGTSTLLAGQTGGVDPGHPKSHEVFYCARGHVAVHNRDSGRYYELREGDILLIEEGEPHQISNIGTETAVVTWSMGPSADMA